MRAFSNFAASLGLLAILGLAAAAPCQRAAPADLLPLEVAALPAGQVDGRAQEGQGHAAEPGLQGEHRSTLAMSVNDIFRALFSHSVPHVWIEPRLSPDPGINQALAIYNVNLFQWVALLLMVFVFVPVRNSFASGSQPGWLVRVFRGWCLWLRDEVVYSVMGEEEGRRFAPYFLFVFFFVCFMNTVGLLPSFDGVWSIYTATGTPYVTGVLALITLGTMLFFGMQKNGVAGFWKGLLPHGLPVALVPLMAVVELVGLVVKPFALTIRLFANMLAGHLVIASAIGLIFVFTKMLGGSWLSYLPALPALGMAVFIFIIESFIVLLQAYVFTYLSCIFLHQAMHQEH